jgi:hypothetical protein
MLAGEIDAHLEPNDFSGRTVAEQLLWGGASALCAEIVRMALEQVDWPPEDPRWIWMLCRPVPGHEDYNPQQQVECCECFRLILARCGPHHRATDYSQTMLHETVSRDHGVVSRSPLFCSMPERASTFATGFWRVLRSDGHAVGGG